jgi:hypothetical protein
MESTESISTIFVVGFPDDMQDREFSNMFTFSQGFEASTLKFPAPGELDESKRQIVSVSLTNAV